MNIEYEKYVAGWDIGGGDSMFDNQNSIKMKINVKMLVYLLPYEDFP